MGCLARADGTGVNNDSTIETACLDSTGLAYISLGRGMALADWKGPTGPSRRRTDFGVFVLDDMSAQTRHLQCLMNYTRCPTASILMGD